MGGSAAGPAPGLVASHGHGARSTEAQHACPRLLVRTELAPPPSNLPMKVTEAQPRSRTCGTSCTRSQFADCSRQKLSSPPNHPTPGGPSHPVGGNLVNLMTRHDF